GGEGGAGAAGPGELRPGELRLGERGAGRLVRGGGGAGRGPRDAASVHHAWDGQRGRVPPRLPAGDPAGVPGGARAGVRLRRGRLSPAAVRQPRRGGQTDPARVAAGGEGAVRSG